MRGSAELRCEEGGIQRPGGLGWPIAARKVRVGNHRESPNFAGSGSTRRWALRRNTSFPAFNPTLPLPHTPGCTSCSSVGFPLRESRHKRVAELAPVAAGPHHHRRQTAGQLRICHDVPVSRAAASPAEFRVDRPLKPSPESCARIVEIAGANRSALSSGESDWGRDLASEGELALRR